MSQPVPTMNAESSNLPLTMGEYYQHAPRFEPASLDTLREIVTGRTTSLPAMHFIDPKYHGKTGTIAYIPLDNPEHIPALTGLYLPVMLDQVSSTAISFHVPNHAELKIKLPKAILPVDLEISEKLFSCIKQACTGEKDSSSRRADKILVDKVQAEMKGGRALL